MTQHDFFNQYNFNIRDDKLGGGSFGTVYKALDRSKNEYVAIKVAEVKQMGGKTFSLEDDVRISNQIPRHRNVAHYEMAHQFEMPNGIFDYAIMPYYPEGDLDNLMRTKTLSEKQKGEIVEGILQGLIHLHNKNIVHRDMKPANILIAKHGYHYIPKIADFGLSKEANDEMNSRFSNSFAGGTLAYSAPEQLLGEPIRFNTDLWALGVIIYELYLGERPFRDKQSSSNSTSNQQYIHNEIINKPIPRKVNSIPQPFQTIVKKCLIKKPSSRVKSGKDLMQLLVTTSPSERTKTYNSNTRRKEQSKTLENFYQKIAKRVDESWQSPWGIPDFWIGVISPILVGSMITFGAIIYGGWQGTVLSAVDWLWTILILNFVLVILITALVYFFRKEKILKMNFLWYVLGVGLVLGLSLVFKPEIQEENVFLDLGIPSISVGFSSMCFLFIASFFLHNSND